MAKKKTWADQSEEEVKEELRPVGLCGHRNLHYTGSEKLTCVLAKGHEGDHAAPLNGKVANWSDAAGEPVQRKHG